MSKRRLLEILVAAAVLALLLAIILVRPTTRAPLPSSIPLFSRVPGAPPDFTSGSYQLLSKRSPDGQRTAVLYPHEWEEESDLYVLTGPGQGARFTLADSLRDQDTPKNLGWLDDRALWVIVGYTYGTVSPGGDLFMVDPLTGNAALMWAADSLGQVQAVDARRLPDGRLEVKLKAFEANLMNPRDSLVVLPAKAVKWEALGLSPRL